MKSPYIAFIWRIAIVLMIFNPQIGAAHQVGELFLVDHFQSGGPSKPAHAIYKKWIREKSLGGIVFWNGDNGDGLRFRAMTREYRQAAQEAGLTPPLFSIDHEGQGVQRLKSRQGFTDLVSPHVLGQVIALRGDVEICKLQGAIMAVELSSVGINSALGTVSDIYRPKSGTRGMFRERAISNEPAVVAACIAAMLQGVAESAHFVFYTKHFPGLGSVNGNTDLGVKTSRAKSAAEVNENLFPYLKAIDESSRFPGQGRLSLGFMTSNATYPEFDEALPAIESRKVQIGLLREDLGFEGLVTSDALWVGQYEGLKNSSFHAALSQIIIGGADQLMIPSGRFEAAYDFLKNFYEGNVSDHVLEGLRAKNGFATKQEVLAVFRQRVDESAARVRRVRGYLAETSYDLNSRDLPRAYSQTLAQKYNEILQSVQSGLR